eukprot:TRINITY_DN22297_c0_g1_i2.p1 TRINITY_DN22297_c0_g1~~TRINITY_DN22297_c0_g1_i2.p1  ORF type:complete len:197 (+),score=21.58 TRINITY_DN22297_c0_g1_i2:193-783(+)
MSLARLLCTASASKVPISLFTVRLTEALHLVSEPKNIAAITCRLCLGDFNPLSNNQDLGDLLALATLQHITTQIQEFTNIPVVIDIVTDGFFFGPVFQFSEHIQQYLSQRNLIIALKCTETLRVVTDIPFPYDPETVPRDPKTPFDSSKRRGTKRPTSHHTSAHSVEPLSAMTKPNPREKAVVLGLKSSISAEMEC